MQKIGLSHFGGGENKFKAIGKYGTRIKGWFIFDIENVEYSEIRDILTRAVGSKVSATGSQHPWKLVEGIPFDTELNTRKNPLDSKSPNMVVAYRADNKFMVKDASWLKTCKKCKLLGVVK